MSNDLRAWLGEAERQRDAAQTALQQGDDRPMKLWALLYGHLLIAKVEELAGALYQAERYMTEKGVSHEYPVMIDIRNALRVPGGGGE